LNKRGKRDAPFMAKVLKNYISKPDLIISSFAVRALSTAKIFADEIDYKKKDIKVDESLYLCSRDHLLSVIKNTPQFFNTLLLFGHNPELTDFCNSISDYTVDNIPTCGIFCVSFNTSDWNEIDFGKGEFGFFEYPKKYFN